MKLSPMRLRVTGLPLGVRRIARFAGALGVVILEVTLGLLIYSKTSLILGWTRLGAVHCPLVLCTALLYGIGLANSERRSRSSHHHHGRHKGRHHQQTNALNHAISFPYHIPPTV